MRRLLPVVLLLAACKEDPSAKLNAVRDQLATGSPTFDDKLTACPTDGSCLGPLAKDLGSAKGYSATTPDQASVGAVAVLVARDGHGEWASGLDEWISVMRKGEPWVPTSKVASLTALQLVPERLRALTSTL